MKRTNGHNDRLPLLNHPLDVQSEFTPQALMEAVRMKRGLVSLAVPEVCILEFDGDLTDHLVQNMAVSPWRAWACFHTPMFALEVGGRPCGIVPRAIGGSYAVLVAEQLLASGARIIVGLTSAGRVSPSLRIPSVVIATAAIRDEGTSFHYLPPSRLVSAPPAPVAPLGTELKRLGMPVYTGTVWTTDAPYRETRPQLDRYAEEGVLAVEMQAASLFALAKVRGAQIAVVAHVSNATDHEGEPFDRGSETEGVQILKAICHAGLAITGKTRAKGLAADQLVVRRGRRYTNNMKSYCPFCCLFPKGREKRAGNKKTGTDTPVRSAFTCGKGHGQDRPLDQTD